MVGQSLGDRLFTKILVRVATSRIIDGLWVGVLGGAGKSEQIVDRVATALTLIKRYDPHRYHRTLSDLDGIVVWLLYDVAVGRHDPKLNMGEIDIRFVLDESTTAELIAATIVHEATHARLKRCGVGYSESVRQRIEAVCFRQEMHFARKLPDGTQIEEWSQYYLTSPPDLTDAAIEKREIEGAMAAARHAGMPC